MGVSDGDCSLYHLITVESQKSPCCADKLDVMGKGSVPWSARASAVKSCPPCFVTKATVTLFLCAWVVPISRGSLLEELVRPTTVKASPRRLDEDACVPLLKPHVPKVTEELVLEV